ncbi:hypothetical protein [Rhizobium sp. Root482]|uniref:hypothetical protein n=1 Tax=Rhizobium sp. Root482 TaxID=1736543 RepID=UPI0006F545DB|nr:hypothetical protein [Rhizobium sp. Root482]KQY12614.1 hypothetical protein ASD31_15400 [Rhizobium sp. Root482]
MKTTEVNRAAVAAGRMIAPANDSQISTDTKQSKPRHSELSETLGALLTWRAMSRAPREPLQTNWRIVPANDNRPEEYREDLEAAEPEPILMDCIHEIRPRPAELIRAVRQVEFSGRRERLPVGGDIETRGGAIVRLGDLRFGTLPTSAFGCSTLPGNDRHIVKWRGRWPVDRFTSAKGPDIDEDKERERRERLADWLGCEPGWHVVSTKEARQAAREKRKRLAGLPDPKLPLTTLSLNEARAFAGLEPVTPDERPALPLGSPDIGNIFSSWLSMPKKGKGGAVARDDDGDFEREVVAANLSQQDVAILDAAITVPNMKDVGAILGATGKTAERAGKKALIKAVANLSKVLDKIAA